LIENDDLIPALAVAILALCDAAQVLCVYVTNQPKAGRRFNPMKSLEIQAKPLFFFGIFDVVAEVFRGLGQAGNWIWRHQMRGVTANIEQANGMYEALDRWLWKQRQHEIEDWLGQSKDLFELEARMRELERRPAYRIW
jgi:hypothetical protein